MGEKDSTLDRYWMAAKTQELCELTGWLVELHTRRPSPPVGHPPSQLDPVAVLVVLVRPPVIAITMHGAVVILHLDGNESLGAQQKVVDLTAPITVPPHQRPVITENAAKPGRNHVLALDPSLQDLLPIGDSAGRHERSRNSPSLAPHGKGTTQPRPPTTLGTSLIPRVPGILNAPVMLGKLVLELSLRSVPSGHSALRGLLKHRARMV